ncbi:4-hydroxy-2-oxovalerate aldolase [Petroclostridium sp. X23]|uniref:4-hydroxy-2-oxovalerate aldolase n=1 Tax=Petroclostridium sp. X23 TaxID=3045146 RepID=UPI0024AE6D78|nr:4-hydroxy-2-oxovalerate aldolase [Petroclostridium sp. X23]WHH59275.1 4-hydroxy-2-oxovalerate aldolase [Petroclostridium sp. X23]
MKKVRIIDTTLRDGMHAVSHQFTPEDMAEIAKALDDAGVDTIEVSHGDGLGGSSFQYGFAKAKEEEYLEAVSKVLTKTKLAVLLLPGIGTEKDLEKAAKNGATVVRVATHVTEADIGEQHIKMAKKLGMEAIGFLMMTHMASAEKIVEQAKLFESYGADAVFVTDSAGAMASSEVKERIEAVKKAISLPIGHHSHNNLGLSIANSLAAVEAGAEIIDGTCKGLGAAAGNAMTEVLTTVFKKMGYETGIDFYKIMDAADDVVAPKLHRPQVITREALSIGYAGTYGSFLLHSLRAAEKFNVDARDILIEMGRRKTVGGQEDMIIDVAYELSHQ